MVTGLSSEESVARRCPGSRPLPVSCVSVTHPNSAWHPRQPSLPLAPIAPTPGRVTKSLPGRSAGVLAGLELPKSARLRPSQGLSRRGRQRSTDFVTRPGPNPAPDHHAGTTRASPESRRSTSVPGSEISLFPDSAGNKGRFAQPTVRFPIFGINDNMLVVVWGLGVLRRDSGECSANLPGCHIRFGSESGGSNMCPNTGQFTVLAWGGWPGFYRGRFERVHSPA
jgi:hypothetical protein